MKIRYERPVCYPAFWSYRLGLFAIALFVISAGLHRFSVMETEIFVVLFSICVGLALLAFLMACYGVLRLWMVGAEGGRASFKGMLSAALVLVPAGIAGYRAYSLPPLYDISTDTANVPAFLRGVSHEPDWVPDLEYLQTAPYEGQVEAYPQVTGRRYEGALDRVLAAVRLVAENQNLAITQTRLPEQGVQAEAESGEEETPSSIIEIESQTPGDVAATAAPDEGQEGNVAEPLALRQAQVLLQGEIRSPVFGFSSDVSIRLSEEAETTFVDMRSVSRFGPHDLGMNARMIESFLTALDAELVGISVR